MVMVLDGCGSPLIGQSPANGCVSVTRIVRCGYIFGIVSSIAVFRKINDQTHDAVLMELQQLPEQFVA